MKIFKTYLLPEDDEDAPAEDLDVDPEAEPVPEFLPEEVEGVLTLPLLVFEDELVDLTLPWLPLLEDGLPEETPES